MKRYRIYTTEGIHYVECDSISIKKSKNGLIVKPKNKDKINAILVMEVMESERVVATPTSIHEGDDLV